jgi:glycosyltransferase involved in cell wall biosynthesis
VVLDDPDDVPGLVNAVRRFESPATRREAGAIARQAAEKHSWTNMAEQYLALIEASRQPAAALV